MASKTTNYELWMPDSTDDFDDFLDEFNENMETIDNNLGGGGGGGGGHVVLNPSGTSMAQEPNLQFAGKVGVADDSVNTKTVVTVPEEIKEVTQAEYEALPDTKLTDGVAYFIKDVNASNVQGYPPLIYSDVEREIGVWRDGKPLYQRTIIYDCADNSNVQTAYSIPNTHFIVTVCDAYFQNSTGGLSQQMRYTWYSAHFWSYIVNNSGHVISVHRETSDGNWLSGVKFFITIQYTKTTDVAGSGIWNGQGGIAHHYSTNETVVGTWFGKPLYEKTFTPTSPATANQVTVIEDITSLNIDVPVDIQGNISNVPINWNLDASNSTTCFVNSAKTGIAMKVINNLLTNITCNITLRYTKTTD